IILPVTAKWLKVLRGQKYILQISLNSNFTSHAFIDSSVTDTSKLLSGLNDYTQYYWRIKAVNIGGESGWSEVWNFKTLGSSFTVELVIPDNQSIYQPVNGLTFKWKKPLERIETILKYQYQLSSDSLFGSYTVNDTTLTDTIKTVNNLNYLTKYFWRVRAGNETGWGDWSSVWQTTTIIEKPATPILALPLNNATKLLNLVTLKWNKTPRAEKYRLEVSEFANFSTHLLIDSTFTDTVKVLPQLEFTKTYYWRVRASNIGGTSEFSAIWNFRTLGLPLVVEPLLPSNNSVNQPMNNLQFVWKRGGEQTLMLNAKPIKGIPNKGSKLISEDQNDEFISQIQKSGHSKSGNDGILAGNPESILNYWLEVTPDTNSNNYLYKDSTLTDTTKIISGFNYYTNYYWRLKARNENGWSDFTSWFKFRTIIERPSKPILASPVNNSVGLIQPITLTWNNSIRAENYTLQVSKDQSFTNVVYTDTTLADTIKALPELEKLTNHFWRVFAKNIGGISDTSEVWTFKTLGVPTTVILISPENNAQNIQTGVNFKWSRANNQELAIKYWIEVGTDTIGTVVAIDSMLTDTTKFIQLENDKNYYWRVRAENEAGWGNFTNWSNFRTIVPLPSIPVLVSPVNNTVWVRINPQMVWNKTTYTEKYHLQIAADSLFTGIIINDSTITDTLKQVDTLQYKTTYYWRVRSINVAGYSNYSTVWDFRTQIKSIIAPTGLQATASIPGKVDLSWIDNSVNELGFAIVRKEGDSTSSNQLTYIDTVSMNIVSFTDTTVIDSVKYSYLVGAFNLDTVSAQSNYATVTTLTGIKEIFAGLIPTEYLIEQNYPNPFNPSTTLRYGLPFESEVKIEMYDITGQRVTSLVNESQKAGYYELSFKIDGLSSGIYFYIIDAKEIGGTGNFRKVKKMILMK
ncbi:MAG: T9SS type A sorting domain-containing protein, partial [Ignavibacteriaceae bacterium]|nr:T9SS type A sorting domain-containing protein [Ignavibacteriaceae bacterium]